MADYFFELLTEEIPAWMHDAAAATLRERLSKLAAELGAETPATPSSSTRRRAGSCSCSQRCPQREADREQEVKGPPKKAAYDADGNPTPALNGFLKKNSAAVEDVIDERRLHPGAPQQSPAATPARSCSERIPEIVEVAALAEDDALGQRRAFVHPARSTRSSRSSTAQHLPIDDLRHRLGNDHRRPSHARAEAVRGRVVQRLRHEARAGARGRRRRRAAAT